jgi:hypothetical protein
MFRDALQSVGKLAKCREASRSVVWTVEFGLQKIGGGIFWELGQDKQHAQLGPGGILFEVFWRLPSVMLNECMEAIN